MQIGITEVNCITVCMPDIGIMFNDFSLTAREPTPDLRGPPWLEEGFEILKGFSYFYKLLWLQLMAYKSHNAPSY